MSVDEFRRRLLPHPRHARQVVARVAAERRVLRVERGGHPRALEDPRLVVQGVIADPALVVEHPDMRIADQLIAVAIAGHDDHVVAAGREPVSRRRDQVVRLPASRLHLMDSGRREHLAHHRELLTEGVGGRFALGFVFGLSLVTERRLGPVERHEHTVGALIAEHVHQHRHQSEHGIRRLSRARCHVLRESEERSIGQRVPIDEEMPSHGRIDLSRGAASRRGCGQRHRASAPAPTSRCAE